MGISLVQRRTVWFPTRTGWLCLFFLLTVPGLLWCFEAEAFLSSTRRQPADVLVVEGWIGLEGFRAAAAEFNKGGYRYLVASGGPTENRWEVQQWNYAIKARDELIRTGVSRDRVLAAPAKQSGARRTFASAVAVWNELRAEGIQPTGLNIFTLGAHARRSRLIFAKVFGAGLEVGVISWSPPDYATGPWWRSSDRAVDLIKETAGYLFEAFFNSARLSNSPDQHPMPRTGRDH